MLPLCIVIDSSQSLKGNERCCRDLVVTVEVFEPAWLHARRYLHDLPVWCVRGSTVTPDEMLSPDEVPLSERGTHFQLYYERDLALMRKSKPQLRRLCAKVAFDLILIDGNEYTGWGEFERVRDECRPRYVALPRHRNSQDREGRGLPRDARGRVPPAPAQGRDGRVAGVRLGRLPPRGALRAERGRLGDLPAVRLLLLGVVVVEPCPTCRSRFLLG